MTATIFIAPPAAVYAREAKSIAVQIDSNARLDLSVLWVNSREKPIARIDLLKTGDRALHPLQYI